MDPPLPWTAPPYLPLACSSLSRGEGGGGGPGRAKPTSQGQPGNRLRPPPFRPAGTGSGPLGPCRLWRRERAGLQVGILSGSLEAND